MAEGSAGGIPAGTGYVDLYADTSKFAASASKGIEKSASSLGSQLRRFGSLLGVGIGAAYAVSFVKQAIAASEEAAKATQRLQALAAGNAAVDVNELTAAFTEMQYALAVDDDALKKLAGTLLSMGFQGTTDELLEQVQAIQDISVATGKGEGIVVRFMAALNNKNLTQAIALGKRFGIITADNATHLKDLVASQRSEAAQQQLMNLATSKYAGIAEQTTTTLERMKAVWDELKETLGDIVTAILEPLFDGLAGFISAFTKASDATKTFLAVIAGGAGLIVALNFLKKALIALTRTQMSSWVIALSTDFIALAKAEGVATASAGLLGRAFSFLAAHPVVLTLTVIVGALAAIAYQAKQAEEDYKSMVDFFKKTSPDPVKMKSFLATLREVAATFGEIQEFRPTPLNFAQAFVDNDFGQVLFTELAGTMERAFQQARLEIAEALSAAGDEVEYFATHSGAALKTLAEFTELTGTEFEAADKVIRQFARNPLGTSLESVKKAFEEVRAGMEAWKTSIVDAFGGAQGALADWSKENGDTFEDALVDLREYMRGLAEWRSSFGTILKGVGPEAKQFLSDMAAGGLENLDLLQAVAGASKKQRQNFIDMYNSANTGTESLANVITDKLLPKFDKVILALRNIVRSINDMPLLDMDTTPAERKAKRLQTAVTNLVLYGKRNPLIITTEADTSGIEDLKSSLFGTGFTLIGGKWVAAGTLNVDVKGNSPMPDEQIYTRIAEPLKNVGFTLVGGKWVSAGTLNIEVLVGKTGAADVATGLRSVQDVAASAYGWLGKTFVTAPMDRFYAGLKKVKTRLAELVGGGHVIAIGTQVDTSGIEDLKSSLFGTGFAYIGGKWVAAGELRMTVKGNSPMPDEQIRTRIGAPLERIGFTLVGGKWVSAGTINIEVLVGKTGKASVAAQLRSVEDEASRLYGWLGRTFLTGPLERFYDELDDIKGLIAKVTGGKHVIAIGTQTDTSGITQLRSSLFGSGFAYIGGEWVASGKVKVSVVGGSPMPAEQMKTRIRDPLRALGFRQSGIEWFVNLYMRFHAEGETDDPVVKLQGRVKSLIKDLAKLGEITSKAASDAKAKLTAAIEKGVGEAAARAALATAKAADSIAGVLGKLADRAGAQLDKLLAKMRSFKDTIRDAFSDLKDLGGLIVEGVNSYDEALKAWQDASAQAAAAGTVFNEAMPTMNLSQLIADQVAQAQELAKALTDAAAAGLSKGVLAQFAAAGADAIPALNELLANPALIDQLNAASATIADAAGQTADALGDKFFARAIHRATERVQNLADAIVKAIAHIQQAMGGISAATANALAAIKASAGGGGGGGGGNTGGGGGPYGNPKPDDPNGPQSPRPGWKPTWEPTWKPGGGGANVTVNVTGWVGNDQRIAEKVRNELIRAGRNNGGTGL